MFTLGTLASVSAASRPELLAPATLAMLISLDLLDQVGVAEIDGALSDTAATRSEFGLSSESLANCVIVGGRREGIEKIAGCVVLASTRADVNSTVKRLLDVRKASFLPMEQAVELTGMEYGGITPIGLPGAWPVLVDSRVIEAGVVIIGSGIRPSKILLPGALLARIPGARIVEGLARAIE